MKTLLAVVFIIVLSVSVNVQAQTGGTFWKPVPRNYEVKNAFEVESLVPMYFYGGYHIGLGYRYKKFRVRVSVINGGDFDAEPYGTTNSSPEYERHYKTSPGVFFGYNVWKNLEVYGYFENHTFEIEQVASAEKKDLKSNDLGIGISYQFFIGRTFYVQPGIHSYFRSEKSVTFSDNSAYSIPTTDISFVFRVGARLWKRFE